MNRAVGILILIGFCTGCAPLRPFSVAEPVDLPGYAKDRVFRDHAVTFAGQPSEDALRAAAADGHGLVVNLRTAKEVEALEFDEPALVESLGMHYVAIPVTPQSFTREDVDHFASRVGRGTRPILVHCASANRVGALWAAYLALHRGVPVEEALAKGRAAGLTKDVMVEATRRVIGSAGGE